MNRIKLYILSVIILALVSWGCESKKTTGPVLDEYINIVIVVNDEYGRPVAGANVTTNPPTEEITTNAEGKAVFENLLVRQYTFYVRRPIYPVYTKTIVLKSSNTQDIEFIVNTLPPDATILYPEDKNFISIYNIRFSGNATDAEDGVLPDSSLVWYSDRDGILGNGKEIFLNTLSLGNHIITMEATDSDLKKDTAAVSINLADYRPDSYFPLPLGAQWTYTHQTSKFSILNDSGYNENWELDSFNVKVDDNNIRTSKMTYRVKIINQTKEYNYTISDEIEMEGSDIFIKKTLENLKVWNGNPFGNPNEELNITTTYNPHQLLIKNVIDPSRNIGFEDLVIAEVTWLYKDPFFGLREFIEKFHVTTTYAIGDIETIETVWNQQFNCIPITITQQESVRTWWVARGIGIVRLKYNSFRIPSVADIFITNMTPYTEEETSLQKIVSDYSFSTPVPVNTQPVPSKDSPERLMELSKILKSLAPR